MGEHVRIEVSAEMVDEARAMGLDPELIAREAIRRALRDARHRAPGAEAAARERARIWQEENREAIESHNRFVDQHGLVADRLRYRP